MGETIEDSARLAESTERRIPGRPWVAGQTGNPGGRPKGIAKYIREQTKDGEELVDLMLECARGEMRVKRWLAFGGTPAEYLCEPSHGDRLEALRFLIERGLGKSLESVPQEVTGPGGMVLASYTSTQLLAVFDRVRQEATDAPALPDSDLKSDMTDGVED